VVFLSETVDSGAVTFLQYSGDGPNDTQWNREKKAIRGLYANIKGRRTKDSFILLGDHSRFFCGVTLFHI